MNADGEAGIVRFLRPRVECRGRRVDLGDTSKRESKKKVNLCTGRDLPGVMKRSSVSSGLTTA